MFTLPLLEGVHNLLFVLTMVAAVATVAVYVLGEEVGLDPTRGLFVSRRATRHLAVLAALLLLVLAFGAWLQIPQLLTAIVGQRHRRHLLRRPRAHARAVGAGRRRRAERRDWRCGRRSRPAGCGRSPRRPASTSSCSVGGTAYAAGHPALRRRAERAGP